MLARERAGPGRRDDRGFLSGELHAAPGLLADLRRAVEVGVPPSRYLGLDWPDPWGDFDCLLDRALRAHDARLCGCGSGLYVEECETAAWTVETRTCSRAEAIAKYREKNPDQPEWEVMYVLLGDTYREDGAAPPVFD